MSSIIGLRDWETRNYTKYTSAMAKITYNISPFDTLKAKRGELCIFINADSGISPDTTTIISNVIVQDGKIVRNPVIGGIGICRYKQGNITFTCDGVVHTFIGVNAASDEEGFLMMAEISESLEQGNAFESATTTTTSVRAGTRAEDPNVVTTSTTDSASTVFVDSLNARDEFALQVLKVMIGKMDDPASVSNSVMYYYCDAAYRWASNMMVLAAGTRSSVEQSEDAKIEVQSLESNADKLLNNILNTLDDLKDQQSENLVGIKDAINDLNIN